MNNRSAIFGSERSINENLREAFSEVASRPHKLSLLFWLFWLQVCGAVFVLLCSILVAFRWLW